MNEELDKILTHITYCIPCSKKFNKIVEHRRKFWNCLKCGKDNKKGNDCECGRHELCNAIRVRHGEKRKK